MNVIDDTATVDMPEAAAVAPLPPLDVVELEDGLTVGGVTYHVLRLRVLTARDLLAAQDASEKVVHTKDGVALVSSPARMGQELMRRQIERLEEGGQTHNGPLSLEELGRLSLRDLAAVQAAADAMDAVDALRAGEGMNTRGRNPGGDGAS